MKRKKFLTTTFLVISVLMITSLSYAYLGGALSNEGKQTAQITTGTMHLIFADGSGVLASKEINIGESITKTFTIENTGTLEATASMYFKDLINTYMTDSMSYRLEYSTSENGIYNVLKEETNVPKSTVSSEELLCGEITVPAGAKYYYKLVITFNDIPDVDQTADLDANLNTKFTLKAGHSTSYWLAQVGYPLTLLNSKGLDLKDYKIYGNSVQNGTPTPSAPVEIESVGEKTRNLLNPNSVSDENLYISSTNGAVLIPSNTGGTWRSSDLIPIKGGKTYYLNANNNDASIAGIAWYTKDKSYLSGINTTIINQNNKQMTAPNEASYIRISWRIDAGYNPNWKETVQFEEGSTATEYEPYGYKIPVKVSGKNLLNQNITNLTLHKTNLRAKIINLDSPITLQPNTYKLTLFTSNEINLRHGLRYSILTTQNGTYKEIYLEGGGQSTNGVFTVDVETTVTGIYVFLAESDNSNAQITIDNVQLELGTEGTDYEPYNEITKNIYLNEPLRKIGEYTDYIDFESKKIIRNVEKIVINGSESWYTTAENGKRRMFLNNRSSVKQNIVLSDKYFKDPVNLSYPDINKIAINSVGSVIIGVDNTIFPDIETYKTWLKANNVIIYLPLATPTEETIELPNIPTLKGVTTIELETDVIPSKMTSLYKSN